MTEYVETDIATMEQKLDKMAPDDINSRFSHLTIKEDNQSNNTDNGDNVDNRIEAELSKFTKHNLMLVKLLNDKLFPVVYGENFYTEALDVGEFAKIAYYQDIAIGTFCCVSEPIGNGNINDSNHKKNIYVRTLGVLGPYRRLGVGRQMLNFIIKQCEKDKTIEKIYLHVQPINKEALQFYTSCGFKAVDVIHGYYRQLPDEGNQRVAVLLERFIDHD